jgi:hypothetical protein
MHYNTSKNMLYENLVINQVQDLLMKMFDGLLLYQLYGNNRRNNSCEKLLIKFVLKEKFYLKKQNFKWFRLVLHHENFRNSYLLHWNPKRHRFIFENFECINLFLMIRPFSLVILSDVIMDYFHQLFPINHHRFFSHRKNVC